MITNPDKHYMQRCLELALLALGNTFSNPLVGSVIVHKGKIIGEGYHQKFGGPHAEVNAIQSVEDKELLRHSTLYVNLEPCAHHGKTPPCSDLIVKSGIPRVVIGSIDTNSIVSGKGIEHLRKHNVKVVYPVLKEKCEFLNRRFFTAHQHKRPYLILKWAQTADGYIDKNRSSNQDLGINWITGPYEKMLVHKWRTEEQAIMAGTNTIAIDNPVLNVREWHGAHPLRIIPDRTLRLNDKLSVFNDSHTTWILNERHSSFDENNTRYVKLDFSEAKFYPQLFDLLYGQGIFSLFIEGGSRFLNSFISNGLWDELRVFTGKFNFEDGLKAPELNKQIQACKIAECMFPDSMLCVYRK